MRLILQLMLVAAAVLTAGDEPGPLDRGEPPVPGAEAPVAAAEPCVVEFDWDDNYRTLVVVGEGVGLVKPAWVATFERTPQRFIVGYRATSFRDARGRLHINAHQAHDVGPQAKNWSPDSFAFGDKLLWAMDDANRGQTTAMGTLTPAVSDAKGWREALLRIQALVEGGL